MALCVLKACALAVCLFFFMFVSFVLFCWVFSNMKNKYLYKKQQQQQGTIIHRQTIHPSAFHLFEHGDFFSVTPVAVASVKAATRVLFAISLHSQGWWRRAAQIVMEPHPHCVVQTRAKKWKSNKAMATSSVAVLDLGAFFFAADWIFFWPSNCRKREDF